MQTEFEAKILEINVDEVIFKLDDLSAEKIGEKMQRRFIYDFNPARNRTASSFLCSGLK